MCLSIPGKVISIDGNMAKVSVGGAEYNASLQLIEDVKPGDFILLHTGFAIQKISEEDANETMKLINELAAISDEIENNETMNLGNDEIH